MRTTAVLWTIACLLIYLGTGAEPLLGQKETLQGGHKHTLGFNEKMRITVPEFQAAGRPMAEVAVSMAYRYKVPMAIEHVDRNALRKPLRLKIKDQSVRRIIAAVVAAVPGYRVDFSQGLVDIYSPAARTDPSNPLNTVISRYDVDGLDTHLADAELLCDIARQLRGRSGCGGSVAGGQWGNRKITLHLRDKRAYEILNAIIAQNGEALWIPMKRPKEGSPLIMGNLWYIYPLDRSFESSALGRLKG